MVAEWWLATLHAALYRDFTKVAGIELSLVRIGFFQTFAIKTVALSKVFEAVCRNFDKFASS